MFITFQQSVRNLYQILTKEICVRECDFVEVGTDHVNEEGQLLGIQKSKAGLLEFDLSVVLGEFQNCAICNKTPADIGNKA